MGTAAASLLLASRAALASHLAVSGLADAPSAHAVRGSTACRAAEETAGSWCCVGAGVCADPVDGAVAWLALALALHAVSGTTALIAAQPLAMATGVLHALAEAFTRLRSDHLRGEDCD